MRYLLYRFSDRRFHFPALVFRLLQSRVLWQLPLDLWRQRAPHPPSAVGPRLHAWHAQCSLSGRVNVLGFHSVQQMVKDLAGDLPKDVQDDRERRQDRACRPPDGRTWSRSPTASTAEPCWRWRRVCSHVLRSLARARRRAGADHDPRRLHDNVVRWLRPLVTTNQQLDDGLDVLTDVLADVNRRSA